LAYISASKVLMYLQALLRDNDKMSAFNLTNLTLRSDRCMTSSSNYRQQLKQMLHCSVGSGLLTKLYTVTHDVMLMRYYTDDVGCHHSDDNDVTVSRDTLGLQRSSERGGFK